MALWLVRAGRYGEREDEALKVGVATIGWNELPDLSSIKSREDLRAVYEKAYPGRKKNTIANEVGQVWAFINRIQLGDLIVLPLKHRSAIAIGKVKGSYEYRNDLSPGIRHIRQVEWVKNDVPRTAFDQDLLYSFGAFMTVCQIQRNNAEERVRAALAGKPTLLPRREGTEEPILVDIEEVASDQILSYLSRKFKGHDLARLVESLLQAEGYVTKRSEAGPDGGVDILAGTGPMGFDSPRLCVQVKSFESPADVTVLRNLQGSITTFGADQGLLVCWGGFTRAVHEEARRAFFSIRLWDSGDLLEALLQNFDRLPDTLQAELPFKRIWALVLEDEEIAAESS